MKQAMIKKYIYLDHAAATPLDGEVLSAMEPYFSSSFFNPSATYLPAAAVKKDLNRARSTVGHWLGAKPQEIIFTAGASEANNLAIKGVMTRYPKGNIVISAIEHESVSAPAKLFDCREVKVAKDGRIDLADLKKKIDDRTVLVSTMQANNEIGTLQPMTQISHILSEAKQNRKSKSPLLWHSDSTQAANYLDLHTGRLKVDLMSLNGSKIYGPKQSGCLYVKSGTALTPLIDGGDQELGLRSGTENVAGCIGFAKALDKAQTLRTNENQRLKNLTARFIALAQEALPECYVNGSLKHRLPNNVSLTLPGRDNERLLILLEQAGILAASGSACSASSEEPSRVLKAIGLTDQEARSTIRFTLGRSTTENDVIKTVQTLAKISSS